MATKKEYSELLNKVLGIDVKWEKLSMEEIRQIVELVTNPDELYARLKKAEGSPARIEERTVESPTFDLLKEAVKSTAKELLRKWDGPILTVLRELLKGGSDE